MSADRFARIETLFHAARAQAPDARAAYLADACGDDVALRREVESLLAEQDLGALTSVIVQPRPALVSGAIIGTYRIVEQIGAGGMGEVYRAHDTKLGRDVALKVLPPPLASDRDRLARLEREARLLAALNHPNIAHVYGLEESDGTRALVMELIEGDTLADRIARGPLPIGEALSIAAQIAAALAAAHEQGIIHRDLKPANIKLRDRSTVKVLDFGLAKSTGHESPESVNGEAPTRPHLRTDSGVVMGTATYMSPEQARGKAVDARTDIFSLGVVLYELMTGHLPFEGSSIYDIMATILSDREAPPLSRYASGMPAEMERIVGKALRKDREARYQTVKDLLLDLQSLRQRLEFERTYPTTVNRDADAAGGGRGRRVPRRLLSGVAWGLLVLAGGMIGYALWRQTHGSPAIKSLAVLPLKSLDAGDNYLGLGIADAAIRRVSQTGRVIVRPTSAVRRYLKEDTDALSAAKQLGVDSVLEGSFQRANDRLRVSVNLLRCNDGASLWSDSFDIREADIFTVEDTVAQQVASRLRLQLDPSQQAQLTKHYTSNPVAYEFYLKGAYTFDQRMRDPRQMLDSTISNYKRAIEADPNFALAHAQLAFAYAVLAVFQDPTQPAWVQHAKEEIDRAQALDPQLAETHLARFQLLYSEFEGYRGEAAAHELLLANQLDSNVGHEQLAYMYNHLGLEDLAAREIARAQEIDPTSDALKQTTLLMYELQSRYDDYAADQTVPHVGRVQALYLMAKGRLDEAQKAIDEWAAKQLNVLELPPTRALLLAVKGDFHAAEAEIPIVLARHPLKDPLYHHAAYDIACIYALEGKSGEAVKWLREAAVFGYHLYPRYTRDAFLERIRQSPEFIQFVAEMKTENDRYRHEFE